MTHTGGTLNEQIHKIAIGALLSGADAAKEQGLYGSGQDLLKDAFSKNVKGMGPAVAEMEIEERESEPFLFFAADKTFSGAYNLPLFLSFADPMYCPGLILSPSIGKGFKFIIMDIRHTEGNRTIELNAPEDTYDIAALLRDNARFVIQSIWSRSSGEQAVTVGVSRLTKIKQRYIGKDDPVHLVRVQGQFPSTGEIISPYSIGHYVAGMARGSHNGPLMPCKQHATVSYFDGPPVVTCAAFCVHNGKLTSPVDLFDHPFWNNVRDNVSKKTQEMRRQGFSGAAMLPHQDLEYSGIEERMKKLDKKFTTKK